MTVWSREGLDSLKPRKEQEEDGLREFLLVLRRALLMVCRWIENRYHLNS